MQKQALHIAYLFASPLIMRNRKSKTAKQVMKIDFETKCMTARAHEILLVTGRREFIAQSMGPEVERRCIPFMGARAVHPNGFTRIAIREHIGDKPRPVALVHLLDDARQDSVRLDTQGFDPALLTLIAARKAGRGVLLVRLDDRSTTRVEPAAHTGRNARRLRSREARVGRNRRPRPPQGQPSRVDKHGNDRIHAGDFAPEHLPQKPNRHREEEPSLVRMRHSVRRREDSRGTRPARRLESRFVPLERHEQCFARKNHRAPSPPSANPRHEKSGHRKRRPNPNNACRASSDRAKTPNATGRIEDRLRARGPCTESNASGLGRVTRSPRAASTGSSICRDSRIRDQRSRSAITLRIARRQ